MGGPGSGKWIRRNPKKETIESKLNISVKLLKDAGYFERDATGIFSWSRNRYSENSIDFEISENKLILEYAHRSYKKCDFEQVVEIIKIQRQPCYYGGHRFWLFCPECNRRVSALYFKKELFRCRICHRLTYETYKLN